MIGYRRMILAGSLGLFLLGGCGSLSDPHQTLKQEQQDRWNGSRVQILMQLARQQYEVGDYDKCRQTLAQGFATGLASAPLHVLAAKVDLEKGQLEAANGHLKQAVQIDAKDPEAYYLLGVLYQRWQNPQAAHDYYQLAFEKQSTQPLYLLAVVEMKLCLGQQDEAQKALEEKIIYFGESAAIRAALAHIYTLKGDFAQASQRYREATILSPDDLALRQNYAESLYYAGLIAEALPVLESLKEVPGVRDPQVVSLLLGETYLQLHRPVEARNLWVIQTRQTPQDPALWLGLAKVYLTLNDLGQAETACRKAMTLQPRQVQGLIFSALIQERQNRREQACRTLQKALAIEPQNLTLLCLLGRNYQQSGKTAEAKACLDQALAIRPEDPWSQELLKSLTAQR